LATGRRVFGRLGAVGDSLPQHYCISSLMFIILRRLARYTSWPTCEAFIDLEYLQLHPSNVQLDSGGGRAPSSPI
jgi:hypothetical protein